MWYYIHLRFIEKIPFNMEISNFIFHISDFKPFNFLRIEIKGLVWTAVWPLLLFTLAQQFSWYYQVILLGLIFSTPGGNHVFWITPATRSQLTHLPLSFSTAPAFCLFVYLLGIITIVATNLSFNPEWLTKLSKPKAYLFNCSL